MFSDSSVTQRFPSGPEVMATGSALGLGPPFGPPGIRNCVSVGRRHPGHRELISLVEPDVPIRAGRDFARVGVGGWQCVHGHRAAGRESVDGVMPGVGESEAAIGARHDAIWGRARYRVLDYAGGRGRGWHRCEERPEDEAGDDGDSAPHPQRLPAAEPNRQAVEFTLGPLA
jgi:hypothetical protein